MSATDDAFGFRADRPDHPDFWKLSDVVLMLDGRMDAAIGDDAKSQVFMDAVSKRIDIASLRYMAMQRALRAVGPNPPLQTMVAAIYMDAFITGCEFELVTGLNESTKS